MRLLICLFRFVTFFVNFLFFSLYIWYLSIFIFNMGLDGISKGLASLDLGGYSLTILLTKFAILPFLSLLVEDSFLSNY